MASADDKGSLIEQFLATRRRIREIERKALGKMGTPAPTGPQCSFCGNTQDEGRILIQGVGEARICAQCLTHIRKMLNGGGNE